MKKVEYVADGWAIARSNGFQWDGLGVICCMKRVAIRQLIQRCGYKSWNDARKSGYCCTRVYRKVSK